MPYHRKTTSQFIAEAQKVHGDKYDYSEVEYVNTHTPVRIRRRRCGVVFLQSPANHLVGRGCPKCSKKQTHKRVTTGNVHRQSQRIAWRQIRLLEDRLSGHAL